MVERRRKPLILCSTKNIINSILKKSSTNEFPKLHLPVGILRFSNKLPSFDHSALIALSTSLLKRLSITSGSPVMVKNAEMNTQRIAVAIALDPPGSDTTTLDINHSPSSSSRIMLVFPSCDFPLSGPLLNGEIYYSCLKSIIHNGQDALSSYFKPQCQVGDEDAAKSVEDSVINIELEPLAEPPRFASLLRVAFVKIPECGVLDSIKPTSDVESKERQDMIDLALQNWNCNSTICIPCNHKTQKKSDNFICFKVIAMEPSDEPVLRVNKTLTALVLVGSSPSALPPDLLIAGPEGTVPLQRDTVKILASILAPTLCPTALSSKFRVSVLLYGLAGCGKRTVVRYVVRRLGLHVVEYNCHDLMGSERTSVALTQVFKTAQRYSPTILLLRHFEVFQDSQSPEVSQNDQRGNTSEVASVIRKFTEPVGEHGDSNSLVKSNGEFVEKTSEKTSGHQVLLIAAADSSEGLPSSIRRCFSHEINMGSLTEEQRAEMLLHSLQNVYGLHSNTDLKGCVKEIVGQTSGFMPRDMCALIADAGASLFPRSNAEVDKDEPEDADSSLISKVTEDNNQSKVSALKPGKEDLVNV
ncbi:cell division control protein C [Trifolium repens]|nr:cell division control protein C [Trifolium repens]